MKNGPEKKYFEIPRPPLKLLLPSAKNLPRMAELAWQVSRYSEGARGIFTIICQKW